MNVLLIGNGPFSHPQWFSALRRRYSSSGLLIVDDALRGVDILRSGVDINAVVICLPQTPEALLLDTERLCGATIDSGRPLPWIIAVRDGHDGADGLLTLRQRGINVATDQDGTLRLLDAARAQDAGLIVTAPAETATVDDAPWAPVAEAPADEAAPRAESDVDVESRLTPRQLEVMVLVNQGKSNKEIARVLDLAEGTVKVHCKAIFRTLGVANRTQAAVLIAKSELDLVARADA